VWRTPCGERSPTSVDGALTLASINALARDWECIAFDVPPGPRTLIPARRSSSKSLRKASGLPVLRTGVLAECGIRDELLPMSRPLVRKPGSREISLPESRSAAGKFFTPAKSYGALLNVAVLRHQNLVSVRTIYSPAQVRCLLQSRSSTPVRTVLDTTGATNSLSK
jgi:hypothetical protein